MTKTHTTHANANTTVSEMDIDDLTARVQKARGLLTQVAALLPGLVTMSTEERMHSNGKLKVGEAAAMTKLLVAAGKHPQMFAAIADKDGGKNDAVFEAQPAIDDLSRMSALDGLTSDAASLAQSLSDTQLLLGGAAQDVATPVHTIINANKTASPALASDAAEALEYYAANGRSAARSRLKNKAKTAAAASK